LPQRLPVLQVGPGRLFGTNEALTLQRIGYASNAANPQSLLRSEHAYLAIFSLPVLAGEATLCLIEIVL
jgi:hypothetical protein